MAIDNNIDHLTEPFRTKAKVLMTLLKKRYPNATVFETLRSYNRQLALYLKGAGVTRTMKSKHRTGHAMDIVFTINKQPKRQGDYRFVHYIAEMCGMKRLKRESCHVEDTGLDINHTMANNSARYGGADKDTQYRLHEANTEFKKYLPTTK